VEHSPLQVNLAQEDEGWAIATLFVSMLEPGGVSELYIFFDHSKLDK
jgi:hypothetical protein